MKGWERSFQPSMKARILVLRSLTDVNTPRRMAWRSTMPNQTSINRPSGAVSTVGGCGGVSGKAIEVALDAGDDARVAGDFGVPATFGGVVS